jgi:hypothetical protein
MNERHKKKFCFVLELRRRRRGTNNVKKKDWALPIIEIGASPTF